MTPAARKHTGRSAPSIENIPIPSLLGRNAQNGADYGSWQCSRWSRVQAQAGKTRTVVSRHARRNGGRTSDYQMRQLPKANPSIDFIDK